MRDYKILMWIGPLGDDVDEDDIERILNSHLKHSEFAVSVTGIIDHTSDEE